jgi:hypothetical protein
VRSTRKRGMGKGRIGRFLFSFEKAGFGQWVDRCLAPRGDEYALGRLSL